MIWLQTKAGSFIALEHVTHITVSVGELVTCTIHFDSGASTNLVFNTLAELQALQQSMTSALSNQAGNLIDVSPFEA